MRGHTLVEVLFVLTLFGATTALFAPSARAYRDRGAVVAAREAVVGLLAQARGAALESGRASVWIGGQPWSARVAVGDSTLREVALGKDFGVELTLSGGRSDVTLTFDGLGLGRMTSQSMRFRRGSASTEAIVSSYGRVRRR